MHGNQRIALLLALLLCPALAACAETNKNNTKTESAASTESKWQQIGSLPHQPAAFTQGLVIRDGVWWESSGLYGRSFVQRRASDQPTRQIALPKSLFAEGLTVLGDTLYLLTWRAGQLLIFDANTLQQKKTLRYQGEGWGLTDNGHQLIMSNGSAELLFRSAEDFSIERRITVRWQGQAVNGLNELEYHQGLILANRWTKDYVLVISAQTGDVLQVLDLRTLYPRQQRRPGDDVLNGIAYDPDNGSWWFTGKFWPLMYQLKLDLPEVVGLEHKSR